MSIILQGKKLVGAYAGGRPVSHLIAGGHVVWERPNLLRNPSFESDESWELWNNTFYVESNLPLLPHSGSRFLNSQGQNVWVAMQKINIADPGTYELSAYFASASIDRSNMLAVIGPDNQTLATKTWDKASAVMTWERRALTVDIPTPMTVQIRLGGNWPRIADVALIRVT